MNAGGFTFGRLLYRRQESLRQLHAYVEKGREAQAEEDMEELEALAAQVHASSHRA